MTKKEFGTLITNEIERKKVTQTAIQKHTGVHHISLKAMKSGEGSYTIDNLLKLFDFLGLDLRIQERK